MQVIAPNVGIRIGASIVTGDMLMTPQALTGTRPTNSIRPNITHNDDCKKPPIIQNWSHLDNVNMNQQQCATQNASRPFVQNAVRPYTHFRPQGLPPTLTPSPLPGSTFISTNSILLPRLSANISKSNHGILLSWNLEKTIDKADQTYKVECYHLFAHEADDAHIAPSGDSKHWKKIGVVNALPLPMACTLTQFTNGSVYFFAVVAVDGYGREGEMSKPCVIRMGGSR